MKIGHAALLHVPWALYGFMECFSMREWWFVPIPIAHACWVLSWYVLATPEELDRRA